jgi:macrolide-specific efflux system membrane fusion protein
VKKTLLILALLGAAYGIWKWKSAAAKPGKVAWSEVKVERGDLVLGVQSTGNVQPQNRVAIRPPMSGRVDQVLVHEGDWVKRGQTLAWMSSADRATLLDAARAKGDDELKRWEELYRATPLIAPISGTVISRAAEPGQNIAPSDSPLVISDRLIVKAQVDETDVAKVKLGQKVRVTLDAYAGESVDAVVDHVAYEARTVSNVTIYDVDVLPRKVPPFMRSGMTANLLFITDFRPRALFVPSEAVQSEASSPYVYVPSALSASARAAAEPVTRAVKLGLNEGTRTEILSGLKEGETLMLKAAGLPSADSMGKNPLGVSFRGKKK